LSLVYLQDLRRARLVLWVDDPAVIYTNATAAFFDEFAEHITIKRFDYQQVCLCLQLTAAPPVVAAAVHICMNIAAIPPS
jgi:hypothetical protein